MCKKFYSYMIMTATNKVYCGYTDNVEERFKKHQEGSAAKFTRANKPIKIVYIKEHASKSEAMKAECALKKLTRPQKEKLFQTFIQENICSMQKNSCHPELVSGSDKSCDSETSSE